MSLDHGVKAFTNFYDQTSSYMDASLALTYLLSIQSYWPVNSSGFLSGVLGMGLDQKKPKSPWVLKFRPCIQFFAPAGSYKLHSAYIFINLG